MIFTVFKIGILRLLNNKQEVLLIFLVPAIFFSIFAMIFTRGIGNGVSPIKVAIADDDAGRFSQALVAELRALDNFDVREGVAHTTDAWPIRRLAREAIREFNLDLLIYIPAGVESQVGTPSNSVSDSAERITVYNEGSNPIQGRLVNLLLTEAVGNTLTRLQIESNEIYRTPPTNSVRPLQAATFERAGFDPLDFQEIDVFAADKSNPKTAMYAAGIAVMFLLFSATGAGGSLLEESEAGTLDRLLVSRLSVTELLAGKWLFITVLGCVQLTVMFSWAQLVFGVDLLGHLAGFSVMTFCTAAATASFAICLAAICRSRAQLNAISILLILTMSALGGSMVPRYIMSDEMKRYGEFTFNGWALDGFKKVFWFDEPVRALGREVTVLLGMSLLLAGVARFWASRWDAR